MYAIVKTQKILNAIKDNFRTGNARGTILHFKHEDYPDRLPFIVATIPVAERELLATHITLFINQLANYNAHIDSDDHVGVVKMVATESSLQYQIMSHGVRGLVRNDGEYPMRRMTLMTNDQALSMSHIFNGYTRDFLVSREPSSAPLVDAVSHIYTEPSMLYDEGNLRRLSDQIMTDASASFKQLFNAVFQAHLGAVE